MPLKLYNTLAHQKETFKPIKAGKVGIYTCGPTVYDYAHLGNLRTYIFSDLLRRTLEYNDYKVKQIMNITDVGHLVSDQDSGEDKIEASARREQKTAKEIAEFYTKVFQHDIKELNIKPPSKWVKATEHIKDQIELIKILEKKGYTYQTSDGIYFNTAKFNKYGKLVKTASDIKAGARTAMREKKSPHDFALWKLSPKNQKRQQEWKSPWGIGFPGWHIECSAMSVKYLGQPFDIHTGGIDHVPIHHTNEIAQSEAAFEKPLANFWLHSEFLIMKACPRENGEGVRMGKSEKNIITISDLAKKGFHPLAFRYLCLTAHYQSKLYFSWQSLQAAQNALERLWNSAAEYGRPKIGCADYEREFLGAINDNLNLPRALAIIWKLTESNYPPSTKKATLLKFDRVLGLDLAKAKKTKIPTAVIKLIGEREKLRQVKKWQAADFIRQKIEKMGYRIEDTAEGPKIKISNY